VWRVARSVFEDAGRLVPTQVEPLVKLADGHPPCLRQYAPNGARIDEIEFHPAYGELERLEHRFGLVRMSYLPGWRGLTSRAPRSLAAALGYLFMQADQALCVGPLLMTDAMCWALERNDRELAARFVPQLASDSHDFLSGAMFVTERAGGSDLDSGEARAVRQADGTWRLYGDKWFCSNPSAELALVLARREGAEEDNTSAMGLFLLPRTLERGKRNSYFLNRLKDKFGTRMTASAEIRFEGALAWPVGKLEQGSAAMMDVVALTRVMIPTAAAGAMRRVAFEAMEYAKRRTTLGRRLDSHPLMQDSLAELVVDATAGLTAAMAIADTFDRAHREEPGSAAVLRLLTPLFNLHASERSRLVAAAGMELRGGNGYVLDWPDARLLRDVTGHGIWQGPPNTLALEVLRAASQGASADFVSELEQRAELVNGGITKPLAPALLQHVRELQTQLSRLPTLDPAAQELDIGRLARRVATTTVAVHLAQQARLLAGETGSSRLAWLAARYAARLGGDQAVARVASDPAWLPHAGALLQGGPVPMEIGERAVEAAAQVLQERL
jgi:acyl-CoA dehydrogenase